MPIGGAGRGFLKICAGAALVLGAIIVGGGAGAHEYRGTADQQASCTPDVFRLCWSEVPDVSRIVGCLKSNRAQLSPGCRAVFAPAGGVRVASHHGRHHFHERHVRRVSSRGDY